MPGFNISSDGGQSGEQPGSIYELHRVHRWKIHQLVVGSRNNLLTADDLLYAKSITLPVFNVEEESVRGGSIAYKFAKGINWDDVTIVFYDVEDLLPRIEKLRQTVWTPESGLRVSNDYKGDSEFWLLNGDGDATRKFVLKNSWIKGISHSDLTYTSSDIKEVTLIVSYDWAQELNGDKPGNYKFKVDQYKGISEDAETEKNLKRKGQGDLRIGTSPREAEALKRPGSSKLRNQAR